MRRLTPYLPAIGVVGLLAIWTVRSSTRLVDPVLLPSPTGTFRAMWDGMRTASSAPIS